VGTSLGHILLVTVPVIAVALVCSGCNDFPLRRSAAAASADTTADPGEPKASRGQRRIKEAASGNSVLEEENFARVRRMLRRLVTAEETFFAENGTYNADLALIGFTPDRNTEVRFLWISRAGWAASGTHPALEGKDCVVFVGQAQAPPTTLKYVRQGREGIPVCDDASRPPKPLASKPAVTPPGPPSPDSGSADSGSALDALSPPVAMKVDLRNLVGSQETYFATQGVYARRTEPLAIQYLWHHDVRIKILSADNGSWAAKATHVRFPGKSCVIWFGPVTQKPLTDAQRRQPNGPGVPACDE
jgi:hypothetical protein